MKHPSLHEVELAAAPAAVEAAPPPAMTRAEKRARWADLLEAHSERIRSLDSIELIRPSRRSAMRADGSALTVAFADPVLREAGLTGDSYAEGRAFFELSHNDMHRLMCRCHIGASETGRATAARVRRLNESPFAPITRAFAALGRSVRGALA